MSPFWIWLAVYVVVGLLNPISGLTIPIFFAIRPPTLHTALNIAAFYTLLSMCVVGILTFHWLGAILAIALPLVQSLVFWRVRLAWIHRHDETDEDDSIDIDDI